MLLTCNTGLGDFLAEYARFSFGLRSGDWDGVGTLLITIKTNESTKGTMDSFKGHVNRLLFVRYICLCTCQEFLLWCKMNYILLLDYLRLPCTPPPIYIYIYMMLCLCWCTHFLWRISNLCNLSSKLFLIDYASMKGENKNITK